MSLLGAGGMGEVYRARDTKHRDVAIKVPADIKVRSDGTVKVLDFGLAKATDPTVRSSADAMNSPTVTVRPTQLGVIGTEQVSATAPAITWRPAAG